jgi:hypothetical protein
MLQPLVNVEKRPHRVFPPPAQTGSLHHEPFKTARFLEVSSFMVWPFSWAPGSIDEVIQNHIQDRLTVPTGSLRTLDILRETGGFAR